MTILDIYRWAASDEWRQHEKQAKHICKSAGYNTRATTQQPHRQKEKTAGDRLSILDEH